MVSSQSHSESRVYHASSSLALCEFAKYCKSQNKIVSMYGNIVGVFNSERLCVGIELH